MEADWTIALAHDDPVITVPWAACGEDVPGCKFFDLRREPALIGAIEEVRQRPLLRSALLRLNGASSQHWTSKCDAWTSSEDEGGEVFDPYEMDATPGETAFGAGSYIDLLPREAAAFSSFACQQQWIGAVTKKLRSLPASEVRVELILRRAEVWGVPGFGVTWFVQGCGATGQRATQRWGEAFDLAMAVILDTCFDPPPGDGTMVETGE